MDRRYDDAVKAGAAFLDTSQPGWALRIDLATLDLSDCYRCVLGQLFGEFLKGAGVLWGGEFMGLHKGCAVHMRDVPTDDLDAYVAFYHLFGFDTPAVSEGPAFGCEREEFTRPHYEELTRLWRAEIVSRTNAVQKLLNEVSYTSTAK